jgi:hypothetical protein
LAEHRPVIVEVVAQNWKLGDNKENCQSFSPISNILKGDHLLLIRATTA